MLGALVVLVLAEAFVSTVIVTAILRYAMVRRALPRPFGSFRALAGPFEALGLDPMIVAGLVFVSLSSIKFLAAWWLASNRLDGAALQLVLLGASSVFWYGFAVPYGPVLRDPAGGADRAGRRSAVLTLALSPPQAPGRSRSPSAARPAMAPRHHPPVASAPRPSRATRRPGTGGGTP